jgi:hypothetical protein
MKAFSELNFILPSESLIFREMPINFRKIKILFDNNNSFQDSGEYYLKLLSE